MQSNRIRYILIAVLGLLLIPVYGNFYIDGWNWELFDFIFAFVLLFGVGSLFELARKKAAGNTAYKFAAGLALAGVFLLVWINAAVGIIGDSDINILYAGVVLTLFIGSIIARLKPRGMSLTLYAAAFVQFLIPILALIVGVEDFRPGVLQTFVLNSAWVVVFALSGILFRQANQQTQTCT